MNPDAQMSDLTKRLINAGLTNRALSTENLEGLLEAAKNNGAWIASTPSGRDYVEKMPLLDELVMELLIRRAALGA